MSREIKFRGLNEETGEFVFGYYTKLTEGIRRFDAIISEIGDELVRFYIHDKETIKQFTGLHDKNGKEIYEGDIIDYFETCRFNAKHETDAIIFADGVFRMERKYGQPLKHCCEVIGNIHENPALLEPEENHNG